MKNEKKVRQIVIRGMPHFGLYANAFFPAHYVPSKVIFPCVKSGDKGSVGLLHGDQQRIVEAFAARSIPNPYIRMKKKRVIPNARRENKT